MGLKNGHYFGIESFCLSQRGQRFLASKMLLNNESTAKLRKINLHSAVIIVSLEK